MPTDDSGRYDAELTDWSLDGTGTHIKYLEAVRAEHILIEAEHDEDEAALTQPRVPQKRFVIKNRAHALESELTLFEGGWLSLRERRSNKPGEAQLLNLRFLDSRPQIYRHVARRTLYATAALSSLGLIAGCFAYFSVLLSVMVPSSIALLFASGVTFAACGYRTQKRVVFCTRHGRAPVLRLLGTIGAFRTLRRIVPEISQVIEEAGRSRTGERVHELRSEMREHYRLRESGIIDQEACAESTQRILSHF